MGEEWHAPGELRQVVIDEDPLDELAERGDARLLEQAPHVVLDGVEPQPGSGFFRHPCRLRLIERRRPAPEEVERLLGLGAGLSGVREDGKVGVSPELHHLERQAEVSDDRVVNMLDARLVDADVVRGPSGAERLALRRQLSDEV